MIFLNIFQEGGSLFMYSLLLILILVLVLLVMAFLQKGSQEKAIKLIGSISLFAVALGFFAQIIGLISAFDMIESVSGISQEMLASGLKISFLAPLFGLGIFLIARMGMIILTWMQKQDE